MRLRSFCVFMAFCMVLKVFLNWIVILTFDEKFFNNSWFNGYYLKFNCIYFMFV